MSCLITAKNVADAFRVVFDLVRLDRCLFEAGFDEDHVMYCFRGLDMNYGDEGSSFYPIAQ